MRSAALILCLAVASVPRVASADAANAANDTAEVALAEAQTHWRELDYDLVVEASARALAAATDDPTRIEALRLQASALVVLGRNEEAEAAFLRIFAADPDYELPDDTSPRVLDIFARARAGWQVEQEKRLATELGPSLAKLSLAVSLPDKPRGGRPLAVAVDLADPGGIADSLILSYRRGAERHYSTITAPAKPGITKLTIPEAFTASKDAYTLELYVRVRHRSGATLRAEGDPEHPLAVAMLAGQIPRSTPVYKKWWFITGVAVGGALLLGVGAFALSESLPAGPQMIEVHR